MEHIRKAARYTGIELTTRQETQLADYIGWLGTEGHRAGGIGPGELDRLERRHIADSILFSSLLNSPVTTWDLGTGVGLPGVPLAIVMPATEFVLIDRSGRRCDLLRRVMRILDLENCQVLREEIENLTGKVETIVSRAGLPPPELARVANRLLLPGGRVVAGGSWVRRPELVGWETVEIPQYVLDQNVWLLMMRPA